MIATTKVLKKICKEYWLIENYDKALEDKENKWVCHHRREVQDGFQIWAREELIKVCQYYDRPANELIFLKQSEHVALHNKAIDPHTKMPCCLIGRDIRGDKNPMYGKVGVNKGKKFSEESRKKMSIAKSKASKWLEIFGYTRAELENMLPLTCMQIRYKAKHHPDELKKIIKETIGG